jgi:hypothetical protein
MLGGGMDARDDDPAIGVLGMSWAEVGARYETHRAAAEGEVSEWAWGPSAAAWERLEPFWSEHCGERPRTRRLRGEPENKSDGRLYGFDAAGQVVVTREYDYRGELTYETLRVRALDADVVLGYSTNPWIGSRRLSQLHAPRFADDGTMSRLDIWFDEEGQPGYRWRGAAYDYEAGRLVASRSARRPPWPGGEVTPEEHARYRYDEAGELLLITDSDEQVLYRRQAAGAAARAARLIRDEFPDRIAAWVARVAPQEELACLIIRYAYLDQWPLPPGLALGTTRELRERRDDRIFDAIEYEQMDFEAAELDTPELRDAYQTLHQEWMTTDDERQPRQLLVAVAKRLAARGWDHLPIAPEGFAIVAVDFEFADLERNLKATVPAKLRRSLEPKGT